ncbi:MAG: hypothetical protein AB1847_11230 [bacterium]
MSNRILQVDTLMALNREKFGTSRVLDYIGVANIKVCAEQYLRVGSSIIVVDTDIQLGWSDLDTGAEENGKDYFVYACIPASGVTPVFKISINSTYPQGYDSSNSRKIGGFHNNPDGSILQYSIWDLDFRPSCPDPRGMVYCSGINKWVDIYLPSDNGSNGVSSAYHGTVLNTVNQLDFVRKGANVGKQLCTYEQFSTFASGSPEGVNIQGSANPVTTGGHVATNLARIKSTIGVEDCTGVFEQFGISYNFRAASFNHSHQENAGAVYTQNATTGSADASAPFEWVNYYAGHVYCQGYFSFISAHFGGKWNSTVYCGTRTCNLYFQPNSSSASISARYLCDSINIT